MGSERGDSDEKPAHTTYIDAVYMDRHEVTNKMYMKFTRTTGHPTADTGNTPTLTSRHSLWLALVGMTQWGVSSIVRETPTNRS